MARLLGLLDPRVADRLVDDEGEFIVDEVVHHWAVYVPRALECLLAAGLGVLAAFIPIEFAFVPILAAVVLIIRALARGLESWVDRFVITNLRVFRSWGLVTRQLATMPIQRILDISVSKPLIGRVLGYGHFVFESAAQDQGLRDIRFVGRPFDRDLTMQRVIQRAGLRKAMPPADLDGNADAPDDSADTDDGDGSSLSGAPGRRPPAARVRPPARPLPPARPFPSARSFGPGPAVGPNGPGPYRSRASRGPGPGPVTRGIGPGTGPPAEGPDRRGS
jgi:hypothetical protein